MLRYLVLLMMLAVAPAAAQNSFPTPGGATVPGYVNMCVVANQAVPCNPGTLPSATTLGTAGATNSLTFLQSGGTNNAVIQVDGSSFYIENNAPTENMFFDSFGSVIGTFIFRTAGPVNVLDYNSTTSGAWTTTQNFNAHHIGGTGTLPTANTCTGFALGTGGSDLGGKITYTSATTCSINFGVAYANAPACTVSPGSAASTTLVTTTTAVLSVTFGTAQTAFSFICVGK